MLSKDQLWYLINGLLKGSYNIKDFCTEFSRIYDLETDYEELSKEENIEFMDLSEMAARFSDDGEELKIPNMYFSAQDIIDKVTYITQKLAQ